MGVWFGADCETPKASSSRCRQRRESRRRRRRGNGEGVSLPQPTWGLGSVVQRENDFAAFWADVCHTRSVYSRHLWRNIPPKVLYSPPQKLVNWHISMLSANACSVQEPAMTSHRHYTIMQWLSASKTVHWSVKIAPTIQQKLLFGDQKSKFLSGEGHCPSSGPSPVRRGHPSPHLTPLLAPAASRLDRAFGARPPPNPLTSPKLAVSRIDAAYTKQYKTEFAKQ